MVTPDLSVGLAEATVGPAIQLDSPSDYVCFLVQVLISKSPLNKLPEHYILYCS